MILKQWEDEIAWFSDRSRRNFVRPLARSPQERPSRVSKSYHRDSRAKIIKPSPHIHLKYKICVSGAAETGHCSPNALELTKEVGKQIVQHNAVLVTGATTGAPFWAAIGAKEAGGFVIGVSPASSESEHVKKYKLPLDYHDIVIYTGFGYSGRNLLLTRSSDAVIITCGRMGTLNEFTISFEDDKPIGVLTKTGGMADEIEDILKKAHRGMGRIIFDSDPKKLVEGVIEMVKKEKVIEI